MKFIFSIFVFLFYFLFFFLLWVNKSCAVNFEANNRVVLKLINHSNKTLAYAGVSKMNIGNTFYVMPKVIVPGGAATIVGIAMPYKDLVGALYFRDEKSNYSNLLHIHDPRMLDIKQPLFAMYNSNLVSFIKPNSFVKNENEDSHSLAYTSATIVIENNI